MKKSIFTVAALVFCTIAASAQSGSALLVPSDSRSIAMGVSALQPTAPKMDAKALFGLWAPNAANNTIVGADVFFRIGDKIAVSAEGREFIDKPYDIVNDKGVTEGTFAPSDLIVGLGGSFAATEQISVGAKLRILSSKLASDIKGSAFCADLSARYSGGIFDAGLSLRNLGSKIDYGAGGYALPAFLAADGTFSPLNGLTVAAEVDYLFAGALMAGLGAEYTLMDIVSVRGGFHYGDASKALPTYVSLGLGVKFAGVHLDAAFLTASEALGNTLLVGLGYSF